MHMCLGFLYAISSIEVDHKIDLPPKDFAELSDKVSKNELQEEEIHQFLSRIVFETRKAVEYRLSKEKAKKSLV